MLQKRYAPKNPACLTRPSVAEVAGFSMSDDRKRICSTHRWLRKCCRAVFEEQMCFPYLVIKAKVLHCTVRCLLKHLEPTISIVGKGISGLCQDPSTHKTFWGHLGLVWCRGFLGPKRNTDRQCSHFTVFRCTSLYYQFYIRIL